MHNARRTVVTDRQIDRQTDRWTCNHAHGGRIRIIRLCTAATVCTVQFLCDRNLQD